MLISKITFVIGSLHRSVVDSRQTDCVSRTRPGTVPSPPFMGKRFVLRRTSSRGSDSTFTRKGLTKQTRRDCRDERDRHGASLHLADCLLLAPRWLRISPLLVARQL